MSLLLPVDAPPLPTAAASEGDCVSPDAAVDNLTDRACSVLRCVGLHDKPLCVTACATDRWNLEGLLLAGILRKNKASYCQSKKRFPTVLLHNEDGHRIRCVYSTLEYLDINAALRLSVERLTRFSHFAVKTAERNHSPADIQACLCVHSATADRLS
jgi:hypothetical protein